MALDMGCYSRHLDIGFHGSYGDWVMHDKTLEELYEWLERSEDTGHYMGYARHAIALEIAKRTK